MILIKIGIDRRGLLANHHLIGNTHNIFSCKQSNGLIKANTIYNDNLYLVTAMENKLEFTPRQNFDSRFGNKFRWERFIFTAMSYINMGFLHGSIHLSKPMKGGEKGGEID